ncbi:MAG TPA: hypothetical protein VI197_17745 [Polyangiaceae bacterium]
MSRSQDALNPEPSARPREPRGGRGGGTQPAPAGWRLARVLLGLALVFGVLTAQGCHKIFGDFSVEPAPDAGDCVSGTHRCVDEFLVACDDGAWGAAQPCLTADRCDSANGGCRVCQPGAGRCNEAWREVCSEDGTAWEPAEECRSAETCDSLACLCPKDPSANCDPCPEGEVRCQAADASNPLAMSNVLAQCTGGVWQTLAACTNEVLCQRTVDIAMSDPGSFEGKCVMAECETPGALGCDGNILRRCAQSQQMWNQVDVCETAEVCAHIVSTTTDPLVAATLTECVAPCSPAGGYRCDGQVVMQCRQDQTGEDPLLTCPENESCDVETGGCRRCTPGEFRCNVATLETCAEDYTWVFVRECETRALCSVTTDSGTGAMQGECLEPSCEAGTFACEGATLLTCNLDRTAMEPHTQCGSSTLCNDTDGRCETPVCAVDGSLECTAGNTLRRCVDGRSRWETVEECPVGTTCSSDPSLTDPCLTECPANPVQCVGNVRRVCSDATGAAIWTVQRTCNTAALCQCALNGNCAQYNSDSTCGEPVCGANLDDVQCNGAWLQACAPGRDQWVDQMDCESEDLCSVDATGNIGACLACPVAGEVQCYNSNTARRTCAADQSGWVNSQNCSYGCVESGTTDYCAVCLAGELRCGSDGELDVCASDRRTLVDEQNCPFTCVNNGNADFCAACAEGETRCNGATELEACSTDLTTLNHSDDCEFSCIDNGLADFCGTCEDGAEQCNGDDLEICSDGVWGGGTECMIACLDDPSGDDFCAEDCDPDTFIATCSGDTLRTCSDDGEFVDTPCSGVCATFGSTARCAECDPGTFENSCDGDELISCSASGVITPAACPTSMPRCIEVSGEGECAPCDPATDADTCTNGTTLRECLSSGDLETTICSGSTPLCTTIAAVSACRACAVGDTECVDEESDRTCSDSGTWGAATACGDDERCTTATDACSCQNGETKCDDDELLRCMNGEWDLLESCDEGCTGNYPLAECEDPPATMTTSTMTATVTSGTGGGTSTTGTGGGTSTTGTGGTSTTGTAGTGGTGGMGGAAGGSAG